MAAPEATPTAASNLVSDSEAKHYYHGLYSRPILVARTGRDTWLPPANPEAYPQPKMLRPVGDHPLNGLWEDILAPKILTILDSRGVKWTSTDVARIGFAGESSAKVCIWIGVKPDTLSRDSGHSVVLEVQQLLLSHDIMDVEVEIRESLITRNIGPKLRRPGRSHDPTAELLEPLTCTIGLFICNTSTPDFEGTGWFYAVDRDSNLYLVTARHVVLPHGFGDNDSYRLRNTSQPHMKIALLGTVGFRNYTNEIKRAITHKTIIIDDQQRRINQVIPADNPSTETDDAQEVADAKHVLRGANRAKQALSNLLAEVEKGWSCIENRVIGHLCFAPSVIYSAAPYQYTQDYALIRLDPTKIDMGNFVGNALDLGSRIDSATFKQGVFPHSLNSPSFIYPMDRLFRVRGVLSHQQINNPTILDQDGFKCHIVMKRGQATGLTIGKANNIASFTRYSTEDKTEYTSMEWAIYPYDNESGSFYAPADSGAAIVDGHGCLGGLLTGGGGLTDSTDVTYATPVSFILVSLRVNGFPVTVHTTVPS